MRVPASDADIGVSQDLLDDLQGDTLRDQQGCCGVTSVMYAGVSYASRCQ